MIAFSRVLSRNLAPLTWQMSTLSKIVERWSFWIDYYPRWKSRVRGFSSSARWVGFWTFSRTIACSRPTVHKPFHLFGTCNRYPQYCRIDGGTTHEDQIDTDVLHTCITIFTNRVFPSFLPVRPVQTLYKSVKWICDYSPLTASMPFSKTDRYHLRCIAVSPT